MKGKKTLSCSLRTNLLDIVHCTDLPPSGNTRSQTTRAVMRTSHPIEFVTLTEKSLVDTQSPLS